MKNLIVTAIPLSLSWVLTYGEWEIMTLIVSFMGPAEVAAWGLLGFLWSLFEQITGKSNFASTIVFCLVLFSPLFLNQPNLLCLPAECTTCMV